MASAAMGFAFFFVGCGGSFRDEITDNGDSVQDPKDSGGQSLGMSLQLFGVSLMSLASCLGEVRIFTISKHWDFYSLFYRNSCNICIAFFPSQGLITGTCWKVRQYDSPCDCFS